MQCLAVGSLPFLRYGASVFDQGRPSRISPTVKEGLGEIAWQAAAIASKELPDAKEDTPLILGLRGFASYEMVLKGTVGGEPTKMEDGNIAIYEAFAEAAKIEE